MTEREKDETSGPQSEGMNSIGELGEQCMIFGIGVRIPGEGKGLALTH